MATPVNYINEPRLNGPQDEAARQTPSPNQDAPQPDPPPEQPPTLPGADEPHTVTLQRPNPVGRPERSTLLSIKITLAGVQFSHSIEEEEVFCERKTRNKIITQELKLRLGGFVGPAIGMSLPLPTTASHSTAHPHNRNQTEGNANHKYIVVGIIGKESSIPHEVLLPTLSDEDLFKQIRKAERELRSPLRRLLSLKRVGGFGLYRCHPEEGYHSTPNISHETTLCLVELYRNYRTEKKDHKNRWMDWIHENFNNDSNDPKEGGYTLQLLLQWSALKLIIWSSIPIIFSLVIGLWYMINPQPGEDYLAIVQTAWAIASYIVTTAALVLAIVASITQFGDS